MNLKPCPFCGGEALEIEHPPHKHVIATFMPDHPGSWTIECVECSVGMIAPTKDEVEGAWNRRADITIPRGYDPTIVAQGWDAYLNGDLDTANPYGGEKAQQWHYGWVEAANEVD